MSKIEYGNCYQFDIPDEVLDAQETSQVIDALLFDLRRTPVGQSFVLDIAIGPESPDAMPWQQFVSSRRKFNRAEFKKEDKNVTREDAIQFLREHFADMLTLPAPGLRRIK